MLTKPPLKERKNKGVSRVPVKTEPIIIFISETERISMNLYLLIIRNRITELANPIFIKGRGLGIMVSKTKSRRHIAVSIDKNASL